MTVILNKTREKELTGHQNMVARSSIKKAKPRELELTIWLKKLKMFAIKITIAEGRYKQTLQRTKTQK